MVIKRKILIGILVGVLLIFGILFFIANTKKESFFVQTFLIKSTIPIGGEVGYKIKIENNENKEREFKIFFDNLEKIAFVEENSFVLGPKQEKEIFISFKDVDKKVAVYSGELVLSNTVLTQKIPIVITAENEKSIFSIIYSEIPSYSNPYPGGKLGLDIKIYDLNSLPVPSIKAESYIQTVGGDILWINEQDLVVDGSKTEVIEIPLNWPKGNYVFVTSVEYGGVQSISSHVFNLSEKSYNFLQNFNAKLLILVGLIILLGFLILFFYLMRSRDEFLTAFKKQNKQELSKNLSVIKFARRKVKKSHRAHIEKKKRFRELKKLKRELLGKIKKKQLAQEKELISLKNANKKKEMQGKLKKWKSQGYKVSEAEKVLGTLPDFKKQVGEWKKKGYKLN